MHWLAILCTVLPAAAFDVLTFPLPSPNAAFFAAKVEPTGGAELLILNQNTLTIYLDADPASRVNVQLRPGTTAVDVADVNGDGRSEVIAISGASIVRYNLPAPTPPEGTELFQLETQFAGPAPAPFIQVLVVDHEGVPVIALPTNEALELRSPSGTLVASTPLASQMDTPFQFGTPFTHRSVNPPQIGSSGALEMRISSLVSFAPSTVGPSDAEESEGVARRRGTARQMVEAADLDPEAWPWFPLRSQPESQERVLYAAADSTFREILIRVRSLLPRPETGEKVLTPGPARRYPGMLVRRDLEQPDFNGDGFADLMLWSPAEPSVTVNALTNAAVHGQWPILLTARYFLPGSRRFDAAPAAHLRLACPLAWYLESPAEAPLGNVVFGDFNGDHRTDFACSTGDNSFSVWLFGEKGMSQRPDFHHQFDEPIRAVAFTAGLRDRNRAAIALRGNAHIFVLAPGPDLPEFPVSIPAHPVSQQTATTLDTVGQGIP